MLVGKYIPNLIAKPFKVSQEYAQLIYDQTSSPRLDKVLKKWDQEKWASAEQRQKFAYIILVGLLAYQFASPVRWIETQDILFTQFSFERFIELGPSPTLTGMASRTLKAKYETKDDSISHSRSILCHAKNVKEIYYQFEDELDAPVIEETPSNTTSPSTPPPPPVTIAAPVVTGVAVSIEELGSVLQTCFSGSLGKYSTALVSRLIGGKMPGGFNSSAIKSHLSKSWGSRTFSMRRRPPSRHHVGASETTYIGS
jgi:fatty acid synthase subunit alpha, fungi type